MIKRLIPIAWAFLAACSSADGPPPAQAGKATIRGPFVHENLALYVIEDPDARSAGDYITLAEGLSDGSVQVTELGQAQVHELQIENRSGRACFVQAGDVVKGGQQDRAIGADFVIPPRSGKMSIPSFCVEHGRWQGQPGFGASPVNLPSAGLKLAVQGQKDQQAVWDAVAKSKKALVDKAELEESRSSSLNEELEKGKVKERREAFLKALSGAVDGHPQAVGLITAINGKLTSADRYVDPGLFRKLFSRMLDSAALEAIAASGPAGAAPSAEAAAAFLARADQGETRQEKLAEGLEAVITENKETARFRCLYNKVELHRQAVAK